MSTAVHNARPDASWLGPWVIAATVAAAAGWWTHAGQVRVPFDSYYYIEFAKQFRETPPSSFGTAWPFGWPLFGAATGLIGLNAYNGLVTLSSISWLALVALVAREWPRAESAPWVGPVTVLAFATTAAALQFVANVFSEVPFSFALLAFALSLARWPDTRAVVLTGALALLAISLRYVGAVCFVLMAAEVARRHLRGDAMPRTGLAAVAITFAIGGGLLFWNRVATGFWGGYPRGAGEPIAAWAGIASDFGWSLPTLLVGLRGRDLLGFSSALGPALGGGVLLLILAAAAMALRRPNATARALGAVVLAYTVAIIALRCIGKFDALHNARTGLPLLALLLLIIAPAFRPRMLVVLPLAWLALNITFLMRGPNVAASADVAPVFPALRTLPLHAFVSANDEARTLSAHLVQRVHRLESQESAHADRFGTAIVLAGNPGVMDGELPPLWKEFARRIVETGSYRLSFDSPNLVLLERVATAAR